VFQKFRQYNFLNNSLKHLPILIILANNIVIEPNVNDTVVLLASH